jgi:uncharacterized membrane protein
VIALALALACAGAEERDDAAFCAEAEAARGEVDWDSFGHAFTVAYCTSCHSANNTDARFGAPAGVDLDTEREVWELRERVRARVLEDATMPVGGGVFEEDRYLLDVYLTCTLGG